MVSDTSASKAHVSGSSERSSPAAGPLENSDGGQNPSTIEQVKDKSKRGPRGPYKKRETAAPIDSAAPTFLPDDVKAVIHLPFNLSALYFDSPTFLLDQREEEMLARPGSVALSAWVHLDPKWASLVLFSLNLGAILSFKTILYLRERRSRAVDAPASPPAASSNGPPKRGATENGSHS